MRMTIGAVLVTLAVSAAVRTAAVHAHGGTSGNYVSRVLGIEPVLAGLDAAVVGRDDQLLLTNRSGCEVTVLGYEGEPYLRFGPDGVFANRKSRNYYLDTDRYGTAVVPATVSSTAPPDWVKVSEGASFAWHDHRIHWMSPDPPPSVRNDRSRRQVVSQWTVPLMAGGEVTVRGQLEWVPSVDGTLWFGMVAVVMFVGMVVGVRAIRSFERGVAIAAVLSATLAVLAVLQGVVVMAGFRGSQRSLLEPGTLILGVALSLLARRAVLGRDRRSALTLAAGTAGLTVVAVIFHLNLVGDSSFEGVADLVFPALLASELAAGVGSCAVVVMALRRPAETVVEADE